ncbi:MAG: CoA pyrophosphatase [Nannocystaceae bacterium]
MPFGPDGVGHRQLASVLDPIHATVDDPSPLQHAAVLGLILSQAQIRTDSRLLLIQRAKAGGTHAGQLAFPGGKPEKGDDSLVSTALREAEEEIFLDTNTVQVLGRLEPVPTPTGFLIVPFIGLAHTRWEPSRHNEEVERILTPTFGKLANPEIHSITAQRTWRGKTWELHRFDIADPPLWGATARMVWDLLQRMRSLHQRSS